MKFALKLLVGGVAILVAVAACTPSSESDPRPTGGTLRIGLSAPPIVDPATVSTFDTASAMVIQATCDTLVDLDAQTLAPVPALAKKFLSTDRGRSQFFLVDDGERVAKSLSKLAAAETGSPGAELLSAIDGYAEIRGEAEAKRSVDAQKLRGIRSAGGVEILLSEDRGDYVRNFATAATAITPCDGAYVSETPERLVRNPKSLRPGSVDAIEVSVFETGAQAAEAFQSSAVDLLFWNWPDDPPAGFEVTAASGVEYVGFPVAQQPFDTVEARIAFARGIATVDAAPTSVRASRFFPPTLGASWDPPGACIENLQPSTEARAPAAQPLEFVYNEEFSDGPRIASALSRVASRPVQPKSVSFANYLPEGSGRFASLFRYAFQSQAPSPFEFARAFTVGGEIARLTGFSDPNYDDAFRRARRALTHADQAAAYASLEEILCKTMPIAPLNFGGRLFLINRDRIASTSKTDIINRALGYPDLRNIPMR